MLVLLVVLPVMANTSRAPRQWSLTKTETITSFESWRQNLTYILSLDPSFAPFLVNGVVWERKSKASPLRGLQSDPETVPEPRRRIAEQKVAQLELMLGQIANYCPIISRNTIVKNATSLNGIWQSIRMHFGFHSTGANFIDFDDIRMLPEERPEDLFQRLMAFVEDNLLEADDGLSHHGEHLHDDEELSPSLENFVILTWLRLIHSDLPKLVKQRYGTELRSCTLATIKPEISQALDSLLDEVRAGHDAKIMRAGGYTSMLARPSPSRSRQAEDTRPASSSRKVPQDRCCPLCKQAGRASFHHFLSKCSYLPVRDRTFMTRARLVQAIENDLETQNEGVPYVEEEEVDDSAFSVKRATGRVQGQQSPYLRAFCGYHPVDVVIDSGAETNLIRESVALRFGANINRSTRMAYQADGRSPLDVVGETCLTLTRDSHSFTLEALVIGSIDVDILAGVPFMAVNDIAIRPSKHQVLLGDDTVYHYGPEKSPRDANAVRRAQARVLRAPSTSTTVWPGEFMELETPSSFPSEAPLALEPRPDSSTMRSGVLPSLWPPHTMVTSVGGRIRIPNVTGEPLGLTGNEHFCQVLPVITPDPHTPSANTSPEKVPTRAIKVGGGPSYSLPIQVDPAPGFKSLVTDDLLRSHRISIELGRAETCNKNPVAEKAIQEVEEGLLRQDPCGGMVSPLALATAVSRLNSRIRSRGLSSRELWTQRDQYTKDRLPVDDGQCITDQHRGRLVNHPLSARSKTPQANALARAQVQVGDLVYLYMDKYKSHARDCYLVVAVEGDWCNVRKFTGSHLQHTSYGVRLSDCYLVCPDDNITGAPRNHTPSYGDFSDNDTPEGHHDITPPGVLEIPPELSTPPLHLDHPAPISDPLSYDTKMSQTPGDIPTAPPVPAPVVETQRRSGRRHRLPTKKKKKKKKKV